ILFYGDPHRDFEPLLEEIENRRPKAVIILGDCDAERPLEQLLAPAIDAIGRENIWWIHGNHDADTPEFYDNTFGSALADQNLHGRVVEIAGVRVAGLGGVFRGQVWYPRELDAEKKFWSQDEYLKSLARQ